MERDSTCQMELSFYQLAYSVNEPISSKFSLKKKIQEKKILHGISGHVSVGSMLAIIGSSGCGKSTLLDVLAGRKNTGHVGGSIYINGAIADPALLNSSRKCGYVLQDDVFLPHLTVRETLNYAYALKLNTKLSQVPHEDITTLLGDLRLLHVADTRIGSPMLQGISGGERRRLSIGVEMVTKPSILLLDEPTSGLDSVNAFRVIETIKALTAQSTTVIMSIHQPSSTIFQLFDHLLILDKGKTVYYGPAQESIDYFGALGFNCPMYTNPAEFFLDIVLRDRLDEERSKSTSKPVGTVFHHAEQADTDFNQVFKDHSRYKHLIQSIYQSSKDPSIRQEFKDLPESSDMFPPYHLTEKTLNTRFWTATDILTHRNWTNTIRDSNIVYVRTGAAMGIALLVGTIFFQLKDDASSIENRINALLFLMCVFSLFCVPAISKLIEDRSLFYRDRSAGSYTTLPYFLSHIIIEIPNLFGIVVGYGVISYWMVGLEKSASAFAYFIAIIFFVLNVGFGLSQLIAACVKSTNMAIAIYMIVLVYSLLLGGFMVPKSSLPSAAQWLIYSSYFYFGFECLVANEFESKIDRYGRSALKALDFDKADKNIDLVALVCFIVIFRVLAYLALRHVNLKT